ncbi:hypothetical protein BH11PSE9_BH11PSE9_27580 [soil metagenome]
MQIFRSASRPSSPAALFARCVAGRFALAALACAALSASAQAADAISTDRPDFVESSDVVGAGRVQIETGFSSERDKRDGVSTRTRSTPTLLRIGVGEALELRVETDGYARRTTRDPALAGTLRERGYNDVSLGAKWRMQEGDEEKGAPGLAWLLHVDVDSGSSAFRGQGLRPSLRGVAEWDLPNDFSVGVMPGVLLDRRADGGRFAAGILAVTFGKTWTPAWHSFVEIAGQQLASKKNGGSVVTFDAGGSYLVTESLQIDLSVSRGLTSDSPRLQWGAGVSFRY